MDALPPAEAVPAGGMPQPFVSPETWQAYQAEAASYAADRVETAVANETRWRRLAYAGLAVGFMGSACAALAVWKHTEHWGLIWGDSATGYVGLVKPIQDEAMTLPAAVDDYFVRRYVELREGFDAANATSAFDAVACMSDRDEQARFAAWYNNSPSAPQQILTRDHGFRTVAVVAAPGIVGKLADGGRRVTMRFRYRDTVHTSVAPEKWGTAWVTVHKSRQAVAACNPAGLVMSDYQRTFDEDH